MTVETHLSGATIDSALAIHRVLGPGLLESAYAAALEIELRAKGLDYERERPIIATYAGQPLGVVYRVDFLIEGKLVVEIKSVSALEPIHTSQLLTYLRLTSLRVGLLLNFNSQLMKQGIRRVLNGF